MKEPKRSNSSTGKSTNKRIQKAEVKAINKTVKYGADSKQANKANAKAKKRISKKY